jgi:serine/threonine-protein kinase HipA
MARKIKALGIWMNGEFVGVWGRNRGEESFQYDKNWIRSKQGRALSLSLPFTPGNQVFTGDVVKFYFDNLLPDSRDIRDRIATKFGASSSSPFDLLLEIGRDCVGAIQIIKLDERPENIKSIKYQELDNSQVASILRNTVKTKALGFAEHNDDLRLSLAGAQEKTALLWYKDKWCLPTGSTPTTHIFKLPLGLIGNLALDMRLSVENEWLCSKIIKAFGLPIAHCDMAMFEESKVLIVERFDRKLSSDGQWIIRLPQEDMCQAKGISPLQKYQNDGGLGVSDCMKLLAGSIKSKEDKEVFFKTQIVFWLLCATDGHAKNFSLFHLPQNRYKLTPLYDVLSAFPVIGNKKNQMSFYDAKLAMSIDSKNRHYKLREIQKRHFVNHAAKVGLNKEDASAMVMQIVQKTQGVINNIKASLAKDFPASVSDKIFNGMAKQANKLL